MKTLLEVLNAGAAYLQEKGVDEARSVMQHLMAHVLGCTRTQLYLNFERPLNEDELVPLRLLMKRSAAGEPLQHLLGSTEFFRREFLTDGRALIPRPETEELVELICKQVPKATPLRILDMGAGSGVIGISLALETKDQAPELTLADISEPALSLALENAMRLGVKVKIQQTNLFSEIEEAAQFDLIVANLPYIPNGESLDTHVLKDPHLALFGGKQGTEIIDLFLEQARKHLSAEGMIALEVGIGQGEYVCEQLQALGYRQPTLHRDLNGIERFPLAHGIIGG